MNDIAIGEHLRDLALACRDATDIPPLFSSALSKICELADADAIVVLTRQANGWATIAHTGIELDTAGLDIDEDTLTSSLSAYPVPDAWLGAGVTALAAYQLPAHAGALLLAWRHDEPNRATTTITTALAQLDSALTRLHVVNDLTDLLLRVDNAQQLANMGDYDWQIATDTNRWSDQLYRIYGHEPQTFNASYERFLEHIHPDDRERIQGIHQHAYATGEPYQMIERIMRPDGELRYLASNGQVVLDENGTPVRMRGTCIDVTDRMLAEQAREQSAARFRSLVESCPDAIIVYDTTGYVVQANRQATELLGADPVGHALAEFTPWAAQSGQGLALYGLDRRLLRVDVTVARLNELTDGPSLSAAFLRDAEPRLAGESTAAQLRETLVRRRQALELNDNVLQGLTAAVYCLNQSDFPEATSYLDRTLVAARRLMNEWLIPLDDSEIEPGDLIREHPSALDEAVMAVPPLQEAPTALRPRVLIVDDNEDARYLLRIQLEALDAYDIVGEAADGEQAVAQSERLQPHVVLLDLAMPIMDGLQALPLIHEVAPNAQVIALSGFDESVMAPTALAAGAARYIEKGLRMDLAALIAGVLEAA